MALRRVAESACGGRIALVTEGGYHLQALGQSLMQVVDALAGASVEPDWPTAAHASNRGRESIDAAKRALADRWTL